MTAAPALRTLLLLTLAFGLGVVPAHAKKKGKNLNLARTAVPTEPLAGDGTYVLSAAEQKFDCKKLTGTMQVRMLQLRASGTIAPTSDASRSTQQLVAPVFGSSTHGATPSAERTRDVAMLHAYNRRLVEKGCPSYDIAQAISGSETPRPTVPGTKAKSKPAPAAAATATPPAQATPQKK